MRTTGVTLLLLALALWGSACRSGAGDSAWTMPTLVPVQAPAQAQAPAPQRPTPQPTAPPAQAANEGGVLVREETLHIPTYPFAAHLTPPQAGRGGVPYQALDRAAMAGPPASKAYRAIVLENDVLALTILPELGGRLYRCLLKPAGRQILYQNPVVKPTRWGPLEADRNWWLAAGGLEWALPVAEHGYEWGVPWNYEVQSTSDSAQVVLWDSRSHERLRAGVVIGLEADRAYFTVQLRVENPTGQAVPVQVWLNALLPATPATEILLPGSQAIVHSSSEPGLTARQVIPWSSQLWRDWPDWLGVFATETSASIAGVYDRSAGWGVARIFDPARTPGVKAFAFGPGFDRTAYTDGGGPYLELWGGPNQTFFPDDDLALGPGQAIEWSERWYPFTDSYDPHDVRVRLLSLR